MKKLKYMLAMLLSGMLLIAASIWTVAPASAKAAVQVTEDGLYVTDDGLYGVRVLENDPGAVDIVKYLAASAPKDLVVPASVPLDGKTIPVHSLSYYAYENHPEIETIELAKGIRDLNGEPFYGCTGVRKVTLPTEMNSFSTTALYSFEQLVEIQEPDKDGSGAASDYISVEFSPQNLTGSSGDLTVTFALKENVRSFSANVYTSRSVNFVSMEPEDPGTVSEDYGRFMIRLGYDPQEDVDYGSSRTYHFRGKNGKGASFMIAGSVPVCEDGGITWAHPGYTTYVVPYNPAVKEHKPVVFTDYLPVPAEVAPMEQQALEAVNVLRAEKGAAHIEINQWLSEAAMVRATEMALADEMSHTRPKGNPWNTVITGLSDTMGENVAAAGYASAADLGANFVALWRTSPVHYANMISADFNSIGIGFAQSPTTGKWYACQLFADVRSGFGMLSIDSVQLLEPYYPGNSDHSTDKAPLESAVQEAKELLAKTISSEDGSGVTPLQAWTLPSRIEMLEQAVSRAERTLSDAWAGQADLDDALDSLERYINSFHAYRYLSQQEKENALKPSIDAARVLLSETVKSVDGTDIPTSQYWATTSAITRLSDAISGSERYITYATVTRQHLDQMQETLRSAVQTFTSARRPGLYASASPSPDTSPVQSAVPSASVSAWPSAPATAMPTGGPGTSVNPIASASPSSSPTSRPTAVPSLSARPSVSVLPSSPSIPTAVTAPAIPGIEGYQGGRLNGKTYYMKTSGASMLIYQKRSSGSLGRVSAPYVTDKNGIRYYPANCGGTVLFPRLKNGTLEAYCIYRDGLEIPVLAVQSLPGPAQDLQTFSLNGKTYYARTSSASMLFYQKRSSGSMGRVSAPYVTAADGTRYYPVNCGGAVLIPQLKDGILSAYTVGMETVLTSAA